MTQEMATQYSAPHGYARALQMEQAAVAQQQDTIERFLATSREYFGFDQAD